MRWTVPVAVAAVIAGGAVVVPQLANADPDLPPASAAELLADLSRAPQQQFSGTVVQTTDLGLPQLPTGAGNGTADVVSLLSGSTTVRVWSGGPERSRVALLGSFAETDVVRDGRDLWTWNSKQKQATHVKLAPHATEAGAGAPLPTAVTPQEAAKQALAAIEPSTTVRLDGTTKVAGRDAYELVLEPKAAGSLVGQVRLAVDEVTSLPLRVQVMARGQSDPAYETGFTGLSFGAPGEGVFRFKPPAGSTVTQKSIGASDLARGQQRPSGRDLPSAPTVVGQDWTSVLVLRGVDRSTVLQGAGGDAVSGALLDGFRPVSGAYGSGRLLRTSLVSALWLDDGRLLVGAVEPSVLEKAAVSGAAASGVTVRGR